jgi:hypothetical protein
MIRIVGSQSVHQIQSRSGGLIMSDSTNREPEEAQEEIERVPPMQHILDNPFLLLFIGIAMPTVFYILWGIMEIISIPIAK